MPDPRDAVPMGGFVDRAFEGVREVFRANFINRGDVGASLCFYHQGRAVVDLWGGYRDRTATTPSPYGPDSLQVVFSTSKGALAICAHLLAQRGDLDLDAPIARYWPEFAAEGKHSIPVRWILSHRTGLVGIDAPLSWEEFLAGDPVVERLARQRPAWEPGTAHGYHPLTFGYLLGEVFRRLTGRTIGEFLREQVAAPLGLDAWIGLPRSKEGRVVPLLDFPPDHPDEYFTVLQTPGTLAARAFTNPPVSIRLFNTPAAHRAEIPAANLITNARSLARLYASCIGKVDGIRLLSEATVESARKPQSVGMDLVLPQVTAIGSGFFLPTPWLPMAGTGSFGHDGLGGSMAFAHPELGLAFAYVMNQCQSYMEGDPRTMSLIQAVLDSLA